MLGYSYWASTRRKEEGERRRKHDFSLAMAMAYVQEVQCVAGHNKPARIHCAVVYPVTEKFPSTDDQPGALRCQDPWSGISQNYPYPQNWRLFFISSTCVYHLLQWLPLVWSNSHTSVWPILMK